MFALLRHPTSKRRQAGLSLVELMVGITVGLFIVAAAATLVANQLGDNRKLLLETQVQQDLRATMDIITRQMRRAGALTPTLVQAGIAASASAGGASNPYGEMSPTAASDIKTQFKFYFDEDQQGPYGFRLNGSVVQTLMPRLAGEPVWQDLTDPNALTVTRFSITPRIISSVALPCPRLCDDGTTSCWPQLVVRSFVVDIEAQAKSDSAVLRGLRNEVRVRNDLIDFNGPPSSPVCPA